MSFADKIRQKIGVVFPVESNWMYEMQDMMMQEYGWMSEEEFMDESLIRVYGLLKCMGKRKKTIKSWIERNKRRR